MASRFSRSFVAVGVAALSCAPACAERGASPTAAVASDAGGSPATPSVRFLALGDSFTIGTGSTPERSFPARLVDRWHSASCAPDLENLGVNGFATDDLIIQELPRVATYHPTFITVAIGANDIVRGSSIDSYRANVHKILEVTKASGARVVAVPQPDWSHSPTAASFGNPDQLADSIARYNGVLADEAAKAGAQWVDLVPLMHDQAAAKELASDGLHPSADAYDAWAAELARLVKSPCPS